MPQVVGVYELYAHVAPQMSSASVNTGGSVSCMRSAVGAISLVVVGSTPLVFVGPLLGHSPSSQGVVTSSLDSIYWQDEAAKVEKGWITVKGKKSRSSPSFDMNLQSHKRKKKGKF